MNEEKPDATAIQIHFGTKAILDELKIIPRESYENVIIRLIDDYRRHHAPRKQEDDPPVAATLPKQEA